VTSSSRSPAPGGPPRPQADDASPDAPRGDEHEAPAKTRLSLTQVAASALAAISATVLMSFFGVAGTIIGAGLASVVTVIGNFLYTRSIEKTHEQLKPVVTKVVARTGPAAGRSRTASIRLGDAATTTTSRGTVVSTSGAAALGVDDGTAATVERTSVSALPADSDPTAGATRLDGTPVDGTADDGAVDPADEQGADEPEPRNAWLRFVEKHGTGKVLAMTAAGLFVVVMGVVLVVELVIGKPLSDAVRGQEGSGTSISRSSTDTDDSSTVPSSPAEDPTNMPSDGTDQGTDDGSTSGTTDAPTDEPTPETTGDTGTGTDTPTDGSTGGTTDGSTDGSTGGTDGSTDDGSDTSGGTSGGTDDGSTGDTGTDTGSGTDTGTGTGTGTGGSDAEQGAGSSSGGSAEQDPTSTATPTPAS